MHRVAVLHAFHCIRAGSMSEIPPRLSAAGNLRSKLTIFVLIGLVAMWIFRRIAEHVVNGDPLTVLDAQLAVWFHAHAVAPLTFAMRIISDMHSVWAMSLAAALFAGFLIRRHHWDWLKLLAVAVPGGMLLNVTIKEIIGRARPTVLSH